MYYTSGADSQSLNKNFAYSMNKELDYGFNSDLK